MIELIINILILVYYISYCILEGGREALYYHYKIKAKEFKDLHEHKLFFMQRIIMLLIIGVAIYFMSNNILITSLELISMVLMFSFFHNGSYYTVRNLLDKSIYKKTWYDDSKTSVAKIEIKYWLRATMASIGLLLWLILLMLNSIEI